MQSEWFWKQVTIGVVKKNNVIQRHRAAADGDAVRPIPIERRWPGLAGTPLVMAEEVPKSERLPFFEHVALEGVLAAKEIAGLAAAYPEPFQDTVAPYYPEYVELHPAPVLPEDFQDGKDRIAGLARRGPFSNQTRRAADGGYEVDLRHIEALRPRDGFLRTGGLAHLSLAGADLKTDWVELDGVRHTPGSDGWPLVERRFLAGLNTHTTLIEHLIRCHMCVAESHVIAAVEALPSRHPLRAMLEPFAIETLLVNGDNIDGLIKSEHSNVPSYSGYPLETINGVIRATAQGFDLCLMDPECRAKEQGILDAGFPTVDDEVELFRLFRHMCERYMREVVQELDQATLGWVKTVDAYIPNGVRKVAGIGEWSDVTLDQVAHVLAVLCYTSSVTHHVMADMVRDYMLSFHIMPPAVREDGFPTRGMVLEKMNSITIAGILRYKLMDDHVVLPDGPAQAIWAEFQQRLNAVQARIDGLPAEQRRWRIHPAKVPSSIHA